MKRIAVCLSAAFAAAIAGAPSWGAPESAVMLPTKTLVSWCDAYLAGQETQSPGVLCATWFLGWIASYRVGANGKQPDGKSVFGICEPAEFSPAAAIRIFATMVHAYPQQFDQQYFNDPAFAVPYALGQAWPCKE